MSLIAMSSTSVTNINDGAQGQQGPQGVSVVSVTPQYCLSNSNSSLPVDPQWSTIRPTVTADTYLWTREDTLLSNGTHSYSNAVYDSTITNLVFDVNNLNNEITSKVSTTDFHNELIGDTTFSYINQHFSTVKQTAEDLNSQVGTLVTRPDGTTITSLSTIEQNADKITWLVTDNSTSSSLTMTNNAITAITNQLVIKDADGNGTVISGGNITTNNIMAHNGYSYINLYDGTFRFGTVGNTAIAWDGSSLTIGQVTQDSIAQAAVAGGLVVTPSYSRPLQESGGAYLYTDSNDQLYTSNTLELIFDNSIGDQTGGWTWFNGQKINVPYFIVDMSNDYVPNVNGYIVLRNSTQYIVWYSKSDAQWYGKSVSPVSNQLSWQWNESNDVVLATFNKVDSINIIYDKYTPAKMFKDIRVETMLHNWGVEGMLNETTTINGGYIETGTISANALATDAIMSRNYAQSISSEPYSKTGTFLNLQNGAFKSKSFYIDESGNAGFKGRLEASTGEIAGFEISDNTISKTSNYNYMNHTKRWIITGPNGSGYYRDIYTTTKKDTYVFALRQPLKAKNSGLPVFEVNGSYINYQTGKAGDYFSFSITPDGYLHTNGAEIENATITQANISNAIIGGFNVGEHTIIGESMVYGNDDDDIIGAEETYGEGDPSGGGGATLISSNSVRKELGLQTPDAPQDNENPFSNYVFWVCETREYATGDVTRTFPVSITKNGILRADGAIINNATITNTSDIRLKTNIRDTEVVGALDLIDKIDIRSFDWKKDGAHQKIGFIADELEKLDERLVHGGGDIYKGIDSFYLLGYVVKAIQELHKEIKELEEKVI